MPLILQLKCGVLMQDRCMKGDDHATCPSTIIMTISKLINVTIFLDEV